MLDRIQAQPPQVVRLFRCWSEVRAEWPGLSDLGEGISGFCFQSREWLDAWMATQGVKAAKRSLFAVVETAQGQKVAFAPFEFTSQKALKVLTFSGGMLCDYSAPLLVDGQDHSQVADLIWSAVTKRAPSFDLFRMRHAPARVGRYLNPFLAWQSMPSALQARTASLDEGWETFYNRTHSKSTRSKLRRKAQNLAAFGELRYETAQTQGAALTILDELFDLKARHLEEHCNTLAAPGHADFYRHLTRSSAGHVRVHALRAGDKVVAAQWGILTRDRYMFLIMSYAGAEWARYSPGLLATRELFAWCHEQGVPAFDFGLGDAPYKARWCDRPSGLVALARGRSIAGHAAAFVLHNRAGRLASAPVSAEAQVAAEA